MPAYAAPAALTLIFSLCLRTFPSSKPSIGTIPHRRSLSYFQKERISNILSTRIPTCIVRLSERIPYSLKACPQLLIPAKPEKRSPQKGNSHLPTATLIVGPAEAKASIERFEPTNDWKPTPPLINVFPQIVPSPNPLSVKFLRRSGLNR